MLVMCYDMLCYVVFILFHTVHMWWHTDGQTRLALLHHWLSHSLWLILTISHPSLPHATPTYTQIHRYGKQQRLRGAATKPEKEPIDNRGGRLPRWVSHIYICVYVCWWHVACGVFEYQLLPRCVRVLVCVCDDMWLVRYLKPSTT